MNMGMPEPKILVAIADMGRLASTGTRHFFSKLFTCLYCRVKLGGQAGCLSGQIPYDQWSQKVRNT